MQCKDCKFWKQGRFAILGECEIDMEGKMSTDSCNRGEPKEKEEAHSSPT